jgi:hypothetical protein
MSVEDPPRAPELDRRFIDAMTLRSSDKQTEDAREGGADGR